ncbi:hypothetical protein QS306_14780 [Paraburkholderia bonniea]|uniref:hypothetical protein n=1 Tax=Paraburkholderia bonniea TaxID=2152891 RepID=UPI0012913FF0|nr:hypothetical protein [Paraburkholderia bonniea]WJF92028.1 hypothetical protein QS306_14780 [Paraburkholderia bonniea]WJF95348.1 hypothetical protein QS308_14785 [Paraburkholderia bonniea]
MSKKVVGLLAGALISATSGLAVAAPAVQPEISQVAPVAGIELFEPFVGISTLQAPGVVKSVNMATRAVTLSDPEHGSEVTFNIDPSGGNLAEIKRGKTVNVSMSREAILGHPTGATGQTRITVPGNSESILAVVQSVDHSTGVISLKKADGSVFRIKGREPLKMAGVAAGQQIMVVMAAQVFISIAPAH